MNRPLLCPCNAGVIHIYAPEGDSMVFWLAFIPDIESCLACYHHCHTLGAWGVFQARFRSVFLESLST